MTLIFIRIFFLVISGIVGFQIGDNFQQEMMGMMVGMAAGCAVMLLESRMRRVSVRGLSSMVFGLILGIVMAKLITDILSLLPLGVFLYSVLKVVFTLVFAYLGAVMALRGKDEFNLIIPYVRFRRQDINEEVVILDTSAIIDGRIADIYKTRFFDARMVVPRFVLEELQRIADSDDDLKRQRGRRGLEILRGMQKDPHVDIQVHEDDLTGNDPVDQKLIRLAKILEAKICTTDFNLNRIAGLQGLKVLNVHELINAVKSVVFSGEIMEVKLIREGKEHGQAVGYTDDGTMVVVSDARDMIGQTPHVEVTSVLQTQAGRMIFGRIRR